MKNITHNILTKLIDSNTKVLYGPHLSFFDSIISQIDSFIVDKRSFFADRVSYDVYMSNDPMSHISERGQLAKYYQINDILLMHTDPLINMKKEDRSLLRNNLANTVKIFFDNRDTELWQDEVGKRMSLVMNYGFPDIEFNESGDRKSVLVINTSNVPQIDMLYQQIKSIYPDSDIIKDIKDYKSIYKTLNEYKTVIELNHNINILLACYCGNSVITPLSTVDYDISKNFDSIKYGVENWSSVIDLIKDRVEKYDIAKFKEQYSFMKEKYSFEVFNQKFCNILVSEKNRPFIL